jgi:hypothetical protein
MGGLTEAHQAELTADIYATLDQVDPEGLPPKQHEKFDARRMMIGQQLQDRRLTEGAYEALERSRSTAGYYLRARGLGPDLSTGVVEIDTPNDLRGARRAADFLTKHMSRIEQDERCLSLLLEYLWIAELGRRPLRGERQPLPTDPATKQDLLGIVRALNRASGDAARHGTRYLEAVLAWTVGDEQTALQTFRELSYETEYEDASRIVRRHIITGDDRKQRRFDGRVERQRSEGHWVLRVDGLNQLVDLLGRDFPRAQLGYGRTGRELEGRSTAGCSPRGRPQPRRST